MTDALVEARNALIGGQESRALGKLVESWRVSRSAEIARVAEALSKRLEPHLSPIAGKLDEFQPLWLAIAKQKRAVDLPRLLGSVLHGSDRFGVAVVNALVDRGKALAAWPADPRASAIIVDHLARGGYESTSKSTYPFWSVMFEMLETHADPRVLARLQKLRFAQIFRTFSDGARRIVWFQEQIDGVVERLAARPPAGKLTSTVSERVTKLSQLIAARGPVPPKEVAAITQQPSVPAPAPKRAAPRAKLDMQAARSHVDAALRALQSGDDRTALQLLLEAWRSTRASRIAELVERISERRASQLTRIDGLTRGESQRAWLAVCREQRAEDLPRLLAAIDDTSGRSTDALVRVNALASWPSDPRTAARAIKVLAKPRFYAGSTRPFWKALIGLVVDHQDPRAADALDALAKRFRLTSTYQDLSSTNAWFKNQLKTAANALRERVSAPSELDTATRKTCDAIAAALATEDDLLAEIYANPDDDRPREVYGDLLQQRGDPRGELIALQLSGREPARAEELVRTHVHAWLAPILSVLDDFRFERGFLAHATITRLIDDSVIGHLLWSTVTHLDVGAAVPDRFSAHPVLKRATIKRAAAPRRR